MLSSGKLEHIGGGNMAKIEMVIDSVRVALINYQRAVILKEKSGERYLPMWVDAVQADAIARSLKKSPASETLTHDCVCSIISGLGPALKYVVVDELIRDTMLQPSIFLNLLRR